MLKRANTLRDNATQHREHQTALICLVTARCAGNKNAQLEDFLPKRITTYFHPMSDEQIALQLVRLNRMFGGTEV